MSPLSLLCPRSFPAKGDDGAGLGDIGDQGDNSMGALSPNGCQWRPGRAGADFSRGRGEEPLPGAVVQPVAPGRPGGAPTGTNMGPTGAFENPECNRVRDLEGRRPRTFNPVLLGRLIVSFQRAAEDRKCCAPLNHSTQRPFASFDTREHCARALTPDAGR